MTKPVVYVIDDCRLSLAAAEALLAVSGYRARCFLSPRGFLSDRTRSGGECVVADLAMSDVAPAAFLRRLRMYGSRLPVILTGFYITPGEVHAWLQRGAFAVVEKPFDAAAFLEAIEQARQAPPYATLCSTFRLLTESAATALLPPASSR